MLTSQVKDILVETLVPLVEELQRVTTRAARGSTAQSSTAQCSSADRSTTKHRIFRTGEPRHAAAPSPSRCTARMGVGWQGLGSATEPTQIQRKGCTVAHSAPLRPCLAEADRWLPQARKATTDEVVRVFMTPRKLRG